LGLLVGELVGFVNWCAYGAYAFIRAPMRTNVNRLYELQKDDYRAHRQIVWWLCRTRPSFVSIWWSCVPICKYRKVCASMVHRWDVFWAWGEKSGCCCYCGVFVFLIMQRGFGMKIKGGGVVRIGLW